MPFRTIAQTDFSGGANYVVNPYLISQKQSARVHNLILDEHGALHTRGGSQLLTTSLDVDHPLVFRGLFVKNDGTSYGLAIHRINTGNKLYVTDPWAVVGTFTTNEALPWLVTINNQAILLNGYETPFQYDGVSFQRITATAGQTVPPGAKHGTFHLGALWLWNTNPSTTTLDGPSSLRASDANNPNSWPNANQTFISKDDGQVGMGCSSFTIVETGISPTATLVLFKNFSAYNVTGVFGAANFSVQQIKSDMGCIAPRTIQFVSGFGIIRLTHKGFALYNGVEDRLISEEIRPLIFGGISGNEYLSGIDFGTLALSWAAQIPNPPIYIAACPVGGEALTRIFLYDLVRRAWSTADFPTALSCLNLILKPGEIPLVQAGSYTGGKIYTVFPINVFDDDNKHVQWRLKTRAFFSNNQMSPTYFRRLLLNVLGEPLHPVTITPIIDGAPAESQRHLIPDGGFGVPAHSAQSPLVETVLNVDILRSGHTVQFDIVGEGRSHIRGLEVHTAQKPPNAYVGPAARTSGVVVPPTPQTILRLRKLFVPATNAVTVDLFLDGNLVGDDKLHNEVVQVTTTPGTHTVTETVNGPLAGFYLPPVFGGDLNAAGQIVLSLGQTADGLIENVAGVQDSNRLLTTGFEEGPALSYVDGGSIAFVSILFETIGGYLGSAPPIVTDIVHTGTYSLKLNGPGGIGGGFPAVLQKYYRPTISLPASVGWRAYVYVVGTGTTPNLISDFLGIFQDPIANENGWYAGIKSTNLNTSFVPIFERGAGTQRVEGSTLSAGQWYRVETWVTADGNGAWTANSTWYQDDTNTVVTALSLSGAGLNTAQPFKGVVFTPLYGVSLPPLDMRVDDFALFKTAGPYGPGRVLMTDPAAVVSADWTVNGAVNNAVAVNYLPTDWPSLPTTNNQSNTAGKTDRFSLGTLSFPANARLTLLDTYVRGSLASADGSNSSAIVVWTPGASNTSVEREGPVRTETVEAPPTGDGHYAVALPSGIVDATYLDGVHVGYRVKGTGTGVRVAKTVWTNVEYVMV